MVGIFSPVSSVRDTTQKLLEVYFATLWSSPSPPCLACAFSPAGRVRVVLLANRYRGKKPAAMQAREADAWREMLDAGEVTKDDLVELAGDVSGSGPGGPSKYEESDFPNSPSHYKRTTYVLDPEKGEQKIQQSDLPAPPSSTEDIPKHKSCIRKGADLGAGGYETAGLAMLARSVAYALTGWQTVRYERSL